MLASRQRTCSVGAKHASPLPATESLPCRRVPVALALQYPRGMRGIEAYKWVGLGLFALVLWVARDVLPPFIIGGILAYLLSPVVDQLADRLKAPRLLLAIGVTLVVVAAFALGVWLLGARLVGEIRALEREGPDILETVASRLAGGSQLDLFGQTVSAHAIAERLNLILLDTFGRPGDALHVVRLAVDLTLNIFLVVLALVYLLVDGHRLDEFFLRFVPASHRARVVAVARDIHRVLARYLRGQLFLIGLMSLVTFAALEWIFHLPYALWLGVLTGFLEVVPIVGPVVAGAIATGVGFAQGGPTIAGEIALMYFILRQLEDQLVMPLVVGRAVHIHPLVTIFAVLTGERIAGVLGMVLAVPVTAAVNVVLQYLYPPLPHEEQVAQGVGAPEPQLPSEPAPDPGRRARVHPRTRHVSS